MDSINFEDADKQPELWFSDGNIVLACPPNAVFRVHRSILSMHSEIFRDMFELVQDGPASGNAVYEGCAVVTLTDALDDVRHFLKALYIRSYFQKGQPIHMDTIASLLRLATKYMVHDLRRDLVEHLETMYPSTLQNFRSTPPKLFLPRRGHAIIAVDMARECNVPSILPAALYRCCEMSVKEIVDGIHVKGLRRLRLAPNDANLCVVARAELMRRTLQSVDDFMWRAEACEDCDDDDACMSALQAIQSTERSAGYHDRCNVLSRERLSDRYTARSDVEMCNFCVDEWKVSEKEGIRFLWQDLPSVMGLTEGWKELKKRQNS